MLIIEHMCRQSDPERRPAVLYFGIGCLFCHTYMSWDTAYRKDRRRGSVTMIVRPGCQTYRVKDLYQTKTLYLLSKTTTTMFHGEDIH